MTEPLPLPEPPVDGRTAPPDARAPLAYRNRDFLESDEGRPLRILAEYLQPLHELRRQGVQDTIVFFGSARLTPDGPLGRYYDEARELARLVTVWSQSLPSANRPGIICTGGGGGIMEAANRGAAEAGGRTVGFNIGLPHEQRPNPYLTPGLSFEFRYFFMRKLWFAHLARAMVVFPGGFGTLDELFEILTLSQTRKIARPIPVLLYGPAYWNEIVDFAALARHGVISPADLELFHTVDTPADAFQALQRGLETPAEQPAPAIAKSITPEDPPEQVLREREETRSRISSARPRARAQEGDGEERRDRR